MSEYITSTVDTLLNLSLVTLLLLPSNKTLISHFKDIVPYVHAKNKQQAANKVTTAMVHVFHVYT